MNRRVFTSKITCLICEMVQAGEQPIIDYAMRSAYEQGRLFDMGKSNCDGIKKLSNHQRGTALDLYLCTSDTLGDTRIEFEWDKQKSDKWHKKWEEMGGKARITLSNGEIDHPHFEGQ